MDDHQDTLDELFNLIGDSFGADAGAPAELNEADIFDVFADIEMELEGIPSGPDAKESSVTSKARENVQKSLDFSTAENFDNIFQEIDDFAAASGAVKNTSNTAVIEEPSEEKVDVSARDGTVVLDATNEPDVTSPGLEQKTVLEVTEGRAVDDEAPHDDHRAEIGVGSTEDEDNIIPAASSTKDQEVLLMQDNAVSANGSAQQSDADSARASALELEMGQPETITANEADSKSDAAGLDAPLAPAVAATQEEGQTPGPTLPSTNDPIRPVSARVDSDLSKPTVFISPKTTSPAPSVVPVGKSDPSALKLETLSSNSKSDFIFKAPVMSFTMHEVSWARASIVQLEALLAQTDAQDEPSVETLQNIVALCAHHKYIPDAYRARIYAILLRYLSCLDADLAVPTVASPVMVKGVQVGTLSDFIGDSEPSSSSSEAEAGAHWSPQAQTACVRDCESLIQRMGTAVSLTPEETAGVISSFCNSRLARYSPSLASAIAPLLYLPGDQGTVFLIFHAFLQVILRGWFRSGAGTIDTASLSSEFLSSTVHTNLTQEGETAFLDVVSQDTAVPSGNGDAAAKDTSTSKSPQSLQLSSPSIGLYPLLYTFLRYHEPQLTSTLDKICPGWCQPTAETDEVSLSGGQSIGCIPYWWFDSLFSPPPTKGETTPTSLSLPPYSLLPLWDRFILAASSQALFSPTASTFSTLSVHSFGPLALASISLAASILIREKSSILLICKTATASGTSASASSGARSLIANQLQGGLKRFLWSSSRGDKGAADFSASTSTWIETSASLAHSSPQSFLHKPELALTLPLAGIPEIRKDFEPLPSLSIAAEELLGQVVYSASQVHKAALSAQEVLLPSLRTDFGHIITALLPQPNVFSPLTYVFVDCRPTSHRAAGYITGSLYINVQAELQDYFNSVGRLDLLAAMQEEGRHGVADDSYVTEGSSQPNEGPSQEAEATGEVIGDAIDLNGPGEDVDVVESSLLDSYSESVSAADKEDAFVIESADADLPSSENDTSAVAPKEPRNPHSLEALISQLTVSSTKQHVVIVGSGAELLQASFSPEQVKAYRELDTLRNHFVSSALNRAGVKYVSIIDGGFPAIHNSVRGTDITDFPPLFVKLNPAKQPPTLPICTTASAFLVSDLTQIPTEQARKCLLDCISTHSPRNCPSCRALTVARILRQAEEEERLAALRAEADKKKSLTHAAREAAVKLDAFFTSAFTSLRSDSSAVASGIANSATAASESEISVSGRSRGASALASDMSPHEQANKESTNRLTSVFSSFRVSRKDKSSSAAATSSAPASGEVSAATSNASSPAHAATDGSAQDVPPLGAPATGGTGMIKPETKEKMLQAAASARQALVSAFSSPMPSSAPSSSAAPSSGRSQPSLSTGSEQESSAAHAESGEVRTSNVKSSIAASFASFKQGAGRLLEAASAATAPQPGTLGAALANADKQKRSTPKTSEQDAAVPGKQLPPLPPKASTPSPQAVEVEAQQPSEAKRKFSAFSSSFKSAIAGLSQKVEKTAKASIPPPSAPVSSTSTSPTPSIAPTRSSVSSTSPEEALAALEMAGLEKGAEISLLDPKWKNVVTLYRATKQKTVDDEADPLSALVPVTVGRYMGLGRNRLLVFAAHATKQGVAVVKSNHHLTELAKASYSKKEPGRVTLWYHRRQKVVAPSPATAANQQSPADAKSASISVSTSSVSTGIPKYPEKGDNTSISTQLVASEEKKDALQMEVGSILSQMESQPTVDDPSLASSSSESAPSGGDATSPTENGTEKPVKEAEEQFKIVLVPKPYNFADASTATAFTAALQRNIAALQ